MATSTKTTKTRAQSTAVEDLSAEKAKALVEAKSLLIQRQSELEKATDHAGEISADWASGDDTFTAAEKVTADADVERLSSLVKAARNRVTRLEREQINTDLVLAEALVPAVEEALYGLVPVAAVIGKERHVSETDSPVVPFVRVLQPEPATDNRGILSGSVVVEYHRNAVFSPLDDDSIEKAARNIGLHLGDGFNMRDRLGKGGTIIDSFKCKIRGFAHFPVIESDPTDAEVEAFADKIRNTIQFAAYQKADSSYASPESLKSKATVLSTHHKSVTKGDERTTTVTMTVRFTPWAAGGVNTNGSARSVIDVVSSALQKAVGQPAEGVGKVTEVKSRNEGQPVRGAMSWVSTHTLAVEGTLVAKVSR